jgi:hypothetical protein
MTILPLLPSLPQSFLPTPNSEEPKVYGGDPRQLKERDKLEGQLSKLNDKANALRAKIAAAVRADRDSR